jgi:hypothetical protein
MACVAGIVESMFKTPELLLSFYTDLATSLVVSFSLQFTVLSYITIQKPLMTKKTISTQSHTFLGE